MENLIISTKKKFAMDKFFLQVKVNSSDDIEKILNVTTKTIFSSAEIANGLLMVSGKCVVRVLYLNNEGKVCSADNISEFIQKQKFDESLKDLIIKDDSKVENYNFSGNEVVCAVAIEPIVIGEYKYQVPCYENDENIVTETNSVKYKKLVCVSEDTFNVAEEFDISDGAVQILAENTNVLLEEISCTVDKVVAEGKIVAEIVVKNETDIFTINREFEFKQEIAAEGVVPSMISYCNLDLKNVSFETEIKNEKPVIISNFEVYAKCFVYEEVEQEIITDLFSLKNDLDIVYDYVEAQSYSGYTSLNDTILSQTNISEIVDFDDIIGVYNPISKIINVEENQDKYIVTNLISAFALYKDSKGISKLEIKQECKYEIFKQEGLLLRDIFATLSINSFKVKAGKELEVVFAVVYSVVYSNSISSKFVKSYEEKTQKNLDDFGVKVYITKKGQTLFEVAKILNIKPEVIETQNVIEGCFDDGQKIYVYSPINLA